MSSPFATRLAAVGAPLGTRHNGESITLSNAADESAPVKAVVEIDDVTSSSEGFIVVTGRLLIETAIVLRKVIPLGTIITAAVRGDQWHVYEQSGDLDGFVHMNIRRKIEEAQHTNIFDLDGNQAVWHEAD